MQERSNVVRFKGQPLTLVGPEIKAGDRAPEFTVVDHALNPVNFSTFKGKVCVLVSVPSLDTSVCDLEARKFNEQAATLGDEVKVLVISMDLPFAQKRWCGANNVANVLTLSDYRDASFGKALGVLIKELRLLARTIFVVDRDGIVQYCQIVHEMTHEPDYPAVLDAVRKQASKQ